MKMRKIFRSYKAVVLKISLSLKKILTEVTKVFNIALKNRENVYILVLRKLKLHDSDRNIICSLQCQKIIWGSQNAEFYCFLQFGTF